MGDDVPVDRKTFLMTDFVNLKIKLTQFFVSAHISRVYVCVNRVACMSIYIYTVFLKKIFTLVFF
jgi:hypothetical protein